FRKHSLNIHERIPTKVPRLLPEATIQAVRARATVNRTYNHGQHKFKYLLTDHAVTALHAASIGIFEPLAIFGWQLHVSRVLGRWRLAEGGRCEGSDRGARA